MGKRDRARRPARRAPSLDPKPRILVLCEGSETEPRYLTGFIAWCRNPRVRVEIVPGVGVPFSIVQAAKARRAEAEQAAARAGDSYLAYDAVWCVFDVDEHPNLGDAMQMARGNQIDVAISNPCFELWLLLHFRESPGAQHRHDVQRMMKDYVADYDKRPEFRRFVDGYADAVKRASRLDLDATEMGEAGRCPTTGVYRLTESIRSAG